MAGLGLYVGFAQRNKEIRRPEVAVILGNLVLQNEVVPPCIPRQLGHQPMVLMTVRTVVGKDQVRRRPALQVFEEFLHLHRSVREETIAVVPNDNLLLPRPLQEEVGTGSSFLFPFFIGAQDNPPNRHVSELAHKPEHRSPGADLNVVAMSPETQEMKGSPFRFCKCQSLHAGPRQLNVR